MTDHLATVADLAVARQAQQKKTRPRRFAVTWPSEAKRHLQGLYFIKGLLPRAGLMVIFGKANSGKTAVALDLVGHIAAQRSWRERRTRGGLVVWLALEAPESFENRLGAWCDHSGIEPGELKLAIVSGLLDLRHKNSVAELLETMAEIEARACEPVALLVIDTLARAMPGANENAGEDMGAVISNLERMRADLGGTSVLLLHHVGKDDTRGPRGHSSLLAAVDSAFEIKEGELIVHKARDAKIGEAIAFELRGVGIGLDEDGDDVTAVVALPANAPMGKARAPAKLSDGSKTALRVLRELLKEEGAGVAGLDAPTGTNAVRLERWRLKHRERYGGTEADSDSTGAGRKAWGRALEQLQAASIVTVSGEWVWVHDRKPHA